MSLAIRRQWLDMGELRVMTRTAREGDPMAHRMPLFFVPGLALSSLYWVPLMQRLARSYRVFAPDPPGFGRSSGSAGPDVREMTDHMLRCMDHLGLDRATVIGNSLGAQVCIELASKHKDRVGKVVLSGPTPDPRARTALKQYARVFANFPLEPPGMNLIYQRDYLLAGIPRMIRTLRRTCDDPVEAKLPHITAKTLIVRGSRDIICPEDWAEEMARLLPNGRVAVVRGVAHNAHYAAPNIVAHLIEEFVEEASLARVRGVRELRVA